MPVLKLRGGGQATLPERVIEELRLGDADQLEAELVEHGVLLRLADEAKRRQAWKELLEIVNEPKWNGPGPEPDEDELMEEILEEIHAMRRENAERRSR